MYVQRQKRMFRAVTKGKPHIQFAQRTCWFSGRQPQQPALLVLTIWHLKAKKKPIEQQRASAAARDQFQQ